MNDVFISYAHIDNETIEEDQKGWITQLHRILQVRLAQLMGAEPRIWRDQKLSGSDLYDQTIVEHFLHATSIQNGALVNWMSFAPTPSRRMD